jgi:hypothetical protein
MTLAVAVATATGLVMASDSRTSSFAKATGQTRVLSDYTQKLSIVGNTAITTSGWAFLSGKNIAAHLSDFASALESPFEPRKVADRLYADFSDRLSQHTATTGETPPAGQDVLSFLVGAYEGPLGHILEVSLPTTGVRPVLDTGPGCGYVIRGQTDVFDRLMKGMDIFRLAGLVDQSGKQDHLLQLAPEMATLEYRIPFPLLNLQDAIDFAVLAIRTTADVQRLTDGTHGNPGGIPGVGGPIAIVAIDSRGVRFAQRTQLQGERPAGQAEGATSG